MLFGMVLRDFQKPDPITITHSESVHLGHLVVAAESVPYLKQSKMHTYMVRALVRERNTQEGPDRIYNVHSDPVD